MPGKKTTHRSSGGTGSELMDALKKSGEGSKELEVVLKSDSMGSAEAVSLLLQKLQTPVRVNVIYSGVGAVSKSDLLMAQSGSRMVIGFNVGVLPKLEQWAREHGVEVRLYNVIYRLAEDIRNIAQSMVAEETEDERVLGRANVIATFKTSGRGIILGCEIKEGTLTVGRNFRVIAAMGPVYSGRLDALHIENREVKEAGKGQHVGIKLKEFKNVKVGDILETYEQIPTRKHSGWRPSGNVLHLDL